MFWNHFLLNDYFKHSFRCLFAADYIIQYWLLISFSQHICFTIDTRKKKNNFTLDRIGNRFSHAWRISPFARYCSSLHLHFPLSSRFRSRFCKKKASHNGHQPNVCECLRLNNFRAGVKVPIQRKVKGQHGGYPTGHVQYLSQASKTIMSEGRMCACVFVCLFSSFRLPFLLAKVPLLCRQFCHEKRIFSDILRDEMSFLFIYLFVFDFMFAFPPPPLGTPPYVCEEKFEQFRSKLRLTKLGRPFQWMKCTILELRWKWAAGGAKKLANSTGFWRGKPNDAGPTWRTLLLTREY